MEKYKMKLLATSSRFKIYSVTNKYGNTAYMVYAVSFPRDGGGSFSFSTYEKAKQAVIRELTYVNQAASFTECIVQPYVDDKWGKPKHG